MFDIQTILNFYTSPFLFATFVWFATVGYFAHVNLLMLFTDLPLKKLYAPVLRYHVVSLAFIYTCAPLFIGIFCMLNELWEPVSLHLANYYMIIYFGSMMYSLTNMVSSWAFKQASSAQFKQSLMITDICLMIVGYVVLMLVQQNFGMIG